MRIVPAVAALALSVSAAAAEPNPQTQCQTALAAAGRAAGIPDHLLLAIGHVESARRDPRTGHMAAWPWTINAAGSPAFFETKDDAVAAVRALQARNIRSIDVGCAQVNLMYHPDAFASLEVAFDPAANAAYAARFLTALHQRLGDWPGAVAAYHSATPDLGGPYQRTVFASAGIAPPPPVPAAPDPVPPARITGRVAVLIPPAGQGDIRVMSAARP